MRYWWRFPGTEFKDGLKLLGGNADSYELALCASDAGQIDFYVEHMSAEQVEEQLTPVKKGVTIEEITEGEDGDNTAVLSNAASSTERDNAAAMQLLPAQRQRHRICYKSSQTSNADISTERQSGSRMKLLPALQNAAGSSTSAADIAFQMFSDFDIFAECVTLEANLDVTIDKDGPSDIHEPRDIHGSSDRHGPTFESEAAAEAMNSQSNANQADANDEAAGNNFHDPDYDFIDGDEDLAQVLDEAEQCNTTKQKERPKGRPQGEEDDVGGQGDSVDHEFEHDSDYAPSDELLTGSDSDGEDEQRTRYPQFVANRDMADPHFEVGMLFKDREELKEAMRNHGIRNRFQVWFPKNDKVRVEAKCRNPMCQWRVYGAHSDKKDLTDPTFQIKVANLTHTCGCVYTNFHMTSKWLAYKYMDEIRDNPNWLLSAFQARVQTDTRFSISMMKAWRARDIALKKINGDEAQQYEKLHDYKLELLRSNPGSTIEFKEEKGMF